MNNMFFSIEFLSDNHFVISGQGDRSFHQEPYYVDGTRYRIASVSNPAFVENVLYIRGTFVDMDFLRIPITKKLKKVIFELMDKFNSKERETNEESEEDF